MVLNRKVTGKATGMFTGVLFGVLTSVLVTLICTAILTTLIANQKIVEEAVGYGAIVVLLVAASLGALVAAEKVKRLRTQVCLITGGVYYLVLLSMTALFFGGQYQGMGVAAIVVIIGSGAVALLGLKVKKSRKRKVTKRAYC